MTDHMHSHTKRTVVLANAAYKLMYCTYIHQKQRRTWKRTNGSGMRMRMLSRRSATAAMTTTTKRRTTAWPATQRGLRTSRSTETCSKLTGRTWTGRKMNMRRTRRKRSKIFLNLLLPLPLRRHLHLRQWHQFHHHLHHRLYLRTQKVLKRDFFFNCNITFCFCIKAGSSQTEWSCCGRGPRTDRTGRTSWRRLASSRWGTESSTKWCATIAAGHFSTWKSWAKMYKKNPHFMPLNALKNHLILIVHIWVREEHPQQGHPERHQEGCQAQAREDQRQKQALSHG